MNQQTTSFAVLRRQRKEKLENSVLHLSVMKGVAGVIAATETWNIIETTMDNNLTTYFQKQMRIIEALGIAAIRDTDPSNELNVIRINTARFEIIVAMATDHRLLIAYSLSTKEPLKPSVKSVKQMKRNRLERASVASMTSIVPSTFTVNQPDEDVPCRVPTKRVGGRDDVVIIEKIGGKEIDQEDDVNNQD